MYTTEKNMITNRMPNLIWDRERAYPRSLHRQRFIIRETKRYDLHNSYSISIFLIKLSSQRGAEETAPIGLLPKVLAYSCRALASFQARGHILYVVPGR